MTKLTPAPDWLKELPIAHRGYHDLSKGRAENSMAAFRAAIDAGFAIECDLQVTATGEPVVFHDPELDRMTGVEGNVRDHSPASLLEMKLLDTADGIHLLSEHLKLVAGEVPVVLELKGVEGEDAGFAEGVAKAVEAYEGKLALMSFDHWICAQFKSLMPNLPRGLTAYGDDETYDTHLKAMNEYDLQFVSYGVRNLPNKFVRDMREIELPIITWTVKDQQSVSTTRQYADQMTFEGFDPRTEHLDD